MPFFNREKSIIAYRSLLDLVSLEEELPHMVSMGGMPDVTWNIMPLRSRHKSLKHPFYP